MEEIDRQALTEAIRKRGPERGGYWQGWIDDHCRQNAIPGDELLALEAEVLRNWGRVVTNSESAATS